jgi:demethylmenaquinone methyltransferase / 2-methoxy-6-polyprenyl-1,4-benzoquinol methylase
VRRNDGTRDGARRARGAAPAAPDLEPAHVAALFDRNAATYDRVNTVITFGLDGLWRRWAARQAAPQAAPLGRAKAPLGGARQATPPESPQTSPPRVLDACAGTGLLSLDLARRGAVVTAVDAAPGMLAVARDRLAAAGLPLRTVVADLASAEAAATFGGPFEAITLGFGLRYFADPSALLWPLRELLAPGGRLVVVEAVRPPHDLLGAAAGLYFFEVAPRLGAALAGHGALYEFLTASTRALGGADDVVAHLRRAGFAVTARRRFACGVVVGLVARPA